MKKHALALAILAVPTVALADGPTLYGKLNVTLDQVSTDFEQAASKDTDIWQLNSNSSRLGVKGDVDTNVAGLKGLYYIEFGIKADDGVTSASTNTSPFSQRNIYVGLKGGFGTIRAGKIDTPLKDSQGKFDQFNDLAGDIQNLLTGEIRANNNIYYTSPKFFDGLTVNLSVFPGEGVDLDNADNDKVVTTDVEDGLTDSYSASIVWEKGPVYAALAHDKAITTDSDKSLDAFTDIDGTTAPAAPAVSSSTAKLYALDTTRATFVYKTDVFEAGALYQISEDASEGTAAVDQSRKDTAWVLSGAYKNGPWKAKLQYGQNDGDYTERSRTETSVGVDYTLGKSTTLLTYWTDVQTDYKTGDAGVSGTTVAGLTTFGIGIDQKF